MLKKLLDNDYVFSILNKLTTVLVGVITSVIVNRYLGPELKGEYAYIINIVNLIVVFGNLGFYQSYPNQKRMGMENQQQKYIDVFFGQFILYMSMATILAVCFKSVMMGSIALLVPIQVLSTQLSMIALIDFIKLRQRMQIIVSVLNTFMYLVLCFFDDARVIYPIILLVVKDLLLIVVYMIKIRCIPKPWKIDKEFLRFIITFGFFSMLSTLLNQMNYKVDVIMMKSFVSNTEIGLYSVGAALAQYAWLIPDGFKEVLFARTAKSNAINSIVVSIKVNLYIVIGMLVGVLLLGRQVLVFLYGYEYINAYSVTCVIFLGIPAMIFFKLIGPLYIANGRQKFYVWVLFISVMVNVVLNMFLIPIYGKVGAALASVGSYSVCGLAFYSTFLREFQVKWYEPLLIKKSDVTFFLRRMKR